jgi:hypothetical protein
MGALAPLFYFRAAAFNLLGQWAHWFGAAFALIVDQGALMPPACHIFALLIAQDRSWRPLRCAGTYVLWTLGLERENHAI